MLFVISSYGSAQSLDREKYDALNDTTKPLTDNIPMADRGDPWDYRASAEEDNGRGHLRNESTASNAMNAPLQKENYADSSPYPPTYPPQQTTVSHPSNAFTQTSQPTPYVNNYSGSGGPIGQPAPTQAHPGGY